MCKFMVEYVKNDSIGIIGTAFLNASDLFGIESEVCKKIAKKHMQAVDYPKTGIRGEELSRKWKGKNKPPERSELVPDFMEKGHEANYKSKKLNSQLFRRLKILNETIHDAINDEENVPKFDNLMYINKKNASRGHIEYSNNALQNL